MAIPRANRYSTIITIGRHKRPSGESLIPATNTVANTITKQKSMFTKQLVTYEIGKTSRGKYIFLTRSFWAITEDAPPVMEAEKKSHGISATNRKNVI